MTVPATFRRAGPFAGNGVTTVFPFSFKAFLVSDVQVRVSTAAGAESAVTTGVSIALNVDQAITPGGYVTFAVAPAVGDQVVVVGGTAYDQTLALPLAGNYNPVALEKALDRVVFQTQQLAEVTARAIVFPETVSPLPAAAARAGYLLGFSGTGAPLLVPGQSGTATSLALDLASTADPAKAAGQVGYSAALAFAAGTVGAKLREVVSVLDYGAKGDGVTDDTAAIQAAINAVQARTGAELYFPPRLPSQYYKVSAPLVVTAPLTIRGAGAYAVQIIAPAGTLTAGQYILDINCAAANTVEHITVQGITVRSLDGVPNGIRVKNASYCGFTDVRTFNVANGLDFDGTRCFSNEFLRYVSYNCGSTAARWLSTFAGGGAFSFFDSTFVAPVGVSIPAGALTDNIAFYTCNWEGCTTRAIQAHGTVQGCTLMGSRGEGGTGHGFEFAPTSSHEVTGLVISGMTYYNGTVAARPIMLGTAAGTGGRVRGFAITGNRVGYAGLDFFCVLNPEAQSGLIAGNHFAETTTQTVSAARAGVVVFGNENGSARLPEYWGTADWGVEQGTFSFTDGSGAGLSFPTSEGRWTKVGRVVHWQARVTYPTTANGASAELAGLPFNVGGLTGGLPGRAGASVDASDAAVALGALHGFTSANEVAIVNVTTLAGISNATLSAKTLYLSGSYAI